LEELRWPPNKEDLLRLYVEQKLSAAKIAESYGLKYANPKSGETLVLYHLKKFGIARRDKAEHVRKVTEEMVDQWARRYQGGASLKGIADDKIDAVTVWNHLTKRGVKVRDKVEAQIAAVSKYERRPFSGDALEKAYLMGLRYGDLHVVRHGRAIRVRVSTTHPAMAKLFESLFSPYGHIQHYPRKASLTGHEWSLECEITRGEIWRLCLSRSDEVKRLLQRLVLRHEEKVTKAQLAVDSVDGKAVVGPAGLPERWRENLLRVRSERDSFVHGASEAISQRNSRSSSEVLLSSNYLSASTGQ
jgi:hypothetical protein